jgi:hypothetical protein
MSITLRSQELASRVFGAPVGIQDQREFIGRAETACALVGTDYDGVGIFKKTIVSRTCFTARNKIDLLSGQKGGSSTVKSVASRQPTATHGLEGTNWNNARSLIGVILCDFGRRSLSS